jgi:23S rRNA pseudouridine1911/1915/1917 synthase
LLPGRDKPPLYSVHRIDRDTSGLLVFARHETAQQALISQFAAHDVARDYLAIVPGRVEPQTIRSMLVRDRGDGLRGSSTNDGGMEAVTRVQPARCLRAEATPEAAAYQELQCTLETGRTHQIRIHLAELGNPVCGDWMYRNRFGAPAIPDLSDAPRLALHAGGLGFQHPTTGAVLRFESTWPSEMQRWIARLQGAPNSVGRTAASESQRQRGQSRRQPGKSGSSSPTRGRKRKS